MSAASCSMVAAARVRVAHWTRTTWRSNCTSQHRVSLYQQSLYLLCETFATSDARYIALTCLPAATSLPSDCLYSITSVKPSRLPSLSTRPSQRNVSVSSTLSMY